MPRHIRIEPTAPPQQWLGAEVTFPVSSHDTGGRFSMQRSKVPGDYKNPAHCHRQENEVFYVESGRVIASTPDAQVELGPGDLVYLPRGVPHQLSGAGEPSTILTMLAPGAIEHAFKASTGDDAKARLA
jgi:mannose-6-phosphate isomerase-like protein (cupin superfamily)